MADRPGRGRIYSRGFSRSVLRHPHSGARIADAGFGENILRPSRLVCLSRTLLLLAAAHETGDLPPARILAVANKPGRPQYILDRKSTRLNSSHANISYAVFCLK